MKTIITISLLSLLLLKMGGMGAFLCVERELIHQAMFSKIEDNDFKNSHLTTISASPENLKKIKWEEQDKEFWLDGTMYDIVQVETKNGIKQYLCLADDAETNIVETIKLLSANGHEPLSKALSNFVSWTLNVVFIEHHNDWNLSPIWTIIEQRRNSFSEQYHQFNFLTKINKPPAP